jgi:heat shock protein HspQ
MLTYVALKVYFSIDFFFKVNTLVILMSENIAKFSIGDVVKHKHFDFRGVIYDVDFEFNNSEEWYESIPKDVRPKKNQPFYHLLAENNDITYEAYVSEQNLINDDSDEPIKHPLIEEIFTGKKGSGYFKLSN